MTLYNFCQTYKPDLLYLAELLVDFYYVPHHFLHSIRMLLIITNFRENTIPNLWNFAFDYVNDVKVLIRLDQFLIIDVRI